MHVICDHNVDSKYVQMFQRAEYIAVTAVPEEPSPDATDEEIVRFAERDDWTVLTTDGDLFEQADCCGLIVYSPLGVDPRV